MSALDTVVDVLHAFDIATDAQEVMTVELPLVVLQKIASYVPSPISFTRITTTCTALSEFVAANATLWDRLYKKRWTFMIDSSRSFTRQNYKERHLEDGETLRRLLEVSEEVGHQQDYGLGHKLDNVLWMQMLRSIGTKSFNLLRSIAKDKDWTKTFYPNVPVLSLTQCLAVYLLQEVHFLSILLQWRDWGESRDLCPRALLISESLWTWEELLSDTHPPATRNAAVYQRLHDLGNQLQQRIDELGDVEGLTTAQIFGLLSTCCLKKWVSLAT